MKYSILAALLMLALVTTCQEADYRLANRTVEPVVLTPLASRLMQQAKDPANPYRAEYTATDEWIARNAQSTSTGPSGQTPPTGQALMATVLDKRGFALPFKQFMALQEEHLSSGPAHTFGKNLTWVQAQGQLPPTEFREFRAEGMQARAAFYPQIPSWVLEAEFKYVSLLPDGRVVTWVQGHPEAPNADLPGKEDNYSFELYDSGGRRLAVTHEAVWWPLFRPELEGAMPGGKFDRREDGYYFLRDLQSDELVGVFDYDGTSVGSADPAWRDPHGFHPLSRELLEGLFEAQGGTRL